MIATMPVVQNATISIVTDTKEDIYSPNKVCAFITCVVGTLTHLFSQSHHLPFSKIRKSG